MSDINLQGGRAPGLVERARAILVSPKDEWPKIAGEGNSTRDIFMGYVVPLAAIGPVAALVGGQLFGFGVLGFSYQPSLIGGLTMAVTSYVLALVSIFLVSWIASFLADKFGGKVDFARAFKLCAYSFTAAWVVAIFQLIPSLSILALLGLYSLYLFYLGATPMMAVPQEKAAIYTAVTVVVAIIINLAAAAAVTTITGGFAAAGAIAAADDGTGTVKMNLEGYGDMTIRDEGDKQTMEIPGVGKVEVTKDGDTVRIEGEEFSAEVEDAKTAE